MVMGSRLWAVCDGCERGAMPGSGCSLAGSPPVWVPGGGDLLGGACVLIFVFVKWLRMAYEDYDKGVVACVVSSVVVAMWAMRSCVRPEAVPAMAGLLVVVGCGLGPGLWRG
ncbi:hypothetical protein ABZX98_32390 [Streptomyces sp. NPDC002992]|uniref:hypothetical protein n=1 Tax=Streptomyces sp. NPDC002992 TaxID=3154273 RepID=UPI00339E1433